MSAWDAGVPRGRRRYDRNVTDDPAGFLKEDS